MNTENWAECAVFKPANQQLVVSLGCVLVVRTEKSTNIGCPIGHPRHAEAQARGNLPTQRNPGRANVTGPGCGGVSLLSGKGRPSQDRDPLPVSVCALTLVYGFGHI